MSKAKEGETRQAPLFVWVRLGDSAEYEKYDDATEAAHYIAGVLAESDPQAPPFQIRWTDPPGIEVGGFTGQNYISLYWGGNDASFEYKLTVEERREFEAAFANAASEVWAARYTLREAWVCKACGIIYFEPPAGATGPLRVLCENCEEMALAQIRYVIVTDDDAAFEDEPGMTSACCGKPLRMSGALGWRCSQCGQLVGW
jgi:hypothetical protein